MTRLSLLTTAVALGSAACFAAWRAPGHRAPLAADPGTTTEGSVSSSDAGILGDAFGGRRPRAREVRRRLREHERDTYIGEILRSRDSALARWPERVDRPIRVWIQPTSAVEDWSPTFLHMAELGFSDWMTTGIPVRFAFTVDSADADVHLAWIDHFEEPISGKTRWARDDDYWITDGDIQIAVHHNHGVVLDSLAVKAITLHEVGHLLGLDHSTEVTNIMTPRVRVRELSPADRSTMQLLYSLPPGPVR